MPKKVQSTDGNSSAAENIRNHLSTRRLWLFRITVAIFVPLVILGGLELGLRLAGYGYPVSFFLSVKINGQDYYIPNDSFAFRFFPPALARTPVLQRMLVRKPAGTYRIFLFGESAAQGDPDPSFGAGRYLQTLLRERFPAAKFEVVCVAMTAINSHVVLPIARECARLDGDLWIIYMGNNEMVGPFGAGTVFGARAPSASLVRAFVAIKATRTGQLLDSLMQRWGAARSTPKTWGGLNMFKEHQLAHDDPIRLRAYENFKMNLTDILRAARNAGVPVILSTVGSNLKDCAPFASMHAKSLSETQVSEWEEFQRGGIAAITRGDYSQALQQFAQAAAIDPHYAELPFLMGMCDLALGNDAQALREFELARDDDALAFRADSRINQIIKEEAEQQAGQGVYALDAAQILGQNSPNKIPGNELFYEHVHLNFEGNYWLGRAFAEETAKLLPKSLLTGAHSEWALPEFCDRRLAVSPWDRCRVWQESYNRISEPPFSDQMTAVPRAQFYRAKLKELSSQMNPEARDQASATYREALAMSPEDTFILRNFAQFLEQTGDLEQAIREGRMVGELVPQTPLIPYKIGSLLVRQGKTSEAEKSFSQALALRRDFVPALNELGLIWAHQRKTAAAVKCFARAIQIDPGSFEAYLNWGFLEQSEGDADQALTYYRAAAERQSGGPPAYFFKAVVSAQALEHGDSIKYFRAAIAMNPQFWQARFLLGLELASQGKTEESQRQFSEVLRLRPDFALAHLQDGAALAKEGKWQAALREFQITLQLNPADKLARQNLDEAEAKIHERQTPSP